MYYKTKLNISYDEKDVAKKHGAQWDSRGKFWYMFHHSNWADYRFISVGTTINENAYESLQKVNDIAKELHKDIFDIIPQYGYEKEQRTSLNNIITLYACQSYGYSSCSDVLYHPDTYKEDLQEQFDKYDNLSGTYGEDEQNKEHVNFMRHKYRIVAENYRERINEYSNDYQNDKIEEPQI